VAFIARLKAETVSASGGLAPAFCPCSDSATSFRCTQQLNKIDIWPAPTKDIVPVLLVDPLALIPSATHGPEMQKLMVFCLF